MIDIQGSEFLGEYWGNTASDINTENTCRVLFQNTNGFDEHADDIKTSDGLERCKQMDISIVAITEHHLNMRHQQVSSNFCRSIKAKLGPTTTYGSSCATDKENTRGNCTEERQYRQQTDGIQEFVKTTLTVEWVDGLASH